MVLTSELKALHIIILTKSKEVEGYFDGSKKDGVSSIVCVDSKGR